jgi:hypothetical protein
MSECLIEYIKLVFISPILDRVLVNTLLTELVNWPFLSMTDCVRLVRSS